MSYNETLDIRDKTYIEIDKMKPKYLYVLARSVSGPIINALKKELYSDLKE